MSFLYFLMWHASRKRTEAKTMLKDFCLIFYTSVFPVYGKTGIAIGIRLNFPAMTLLGGNREDNIF